MSAVRKIAWSLGRIINRKMQPGAECGSQNRGSTYFAEEEGEGQAGEEKEKNATLLQVTFIYSKTTEATLTAHRQENSNASNGLVVNNSYMALLGLNNQVTCPCGSSMEGTDEK